MELSPLPEFRGRHHSSGHSGFAWKDLSSSFLSTGALEAARPVRHLLLLLPSLCCISKNFYSHFKIFYSNWIFAGGKEGEK